MIRRTAILGALAVIGASWAGCARPTPAQQSSMVQEALCGQGMPVLKEHVATSLQALHAGAKKGNKFPCEVLDGNPDWTCYSCAPGAPLPPEVESIAGTATITVTGTHAGVSGEATMSVAYALDVTVTTTPANPLPREGATGYQRRLRYVSTSISAQGSKKQHFKGTASLTVAGGASGGSVAIDTTCDLVYAGNFFVESPDGITPGECKPGGCASVEMGEAAIACEMDGGTSSDGGSDGGVGDGGAGTGTGVDAGVSSTF